MNVIAPNIMIFELVKTSTGRPPYFTHLHGPVLIIKEKDLLSDQND